MTFLGKPNDKTQAWCEKHHKLASSPLHFIAKQACRLGIVKNGTPYSISLETSRDGKTWQEYKINWWLDMAADETIFFRAAGNGAEGFSKDTGNCYQFVVESGSVECHGNVMSLAYKDFEGKVSLQNGSETGICFCRLFSNVRMMTTAPDLPATTLAAGCYAYMFQNCTSLETAPALPAMALADGCYQYMFYGCTSLETAPALDATQLAVGCYNCMFSSCIALSQAPALPASQLTHQCYRAMFQSCISLTVAPKLDATELAEGCYCIMFEGCENLRVREGAGEGFKFLDIPAGTVTYAEWNSDMLMGTGGTYDWDPKVGKAYYCY